MKNKDVNSLDHTSWRCQYHIVFAPKYRRMEIYGQICGIIATAITILQPQFRSKVQIMICGILINTMNALKFTLIGQTGSAVFVCLIAIVQSMIAVWHEKRGTRVSTFESVLFLFLYVRSGLFGVMSAEGFVWEISWEKILELLPTVGALMFMCSVFARGEQKTRFFLLLNGASWVVYTAVIGAAAFFSCMVSVISSGVALWKYRKKCA